MEVESKIAVISVGFTVTGVQGGNIWLRLSPLIQAAFLMFHVSTARVNLNIFLCLKFVYLFNAKFFTPSCKISHE